MKKIVVTGFEPFGGETVNPALESAKQLKDWHVEGYQVVVREIPTVFGLSCERLIQAIEETDPDLVICIGQAGGRPDITVERVAINVNDASIPDNGNNQPVDTPIVEGGPVAYWSTLPIKAMVKDMKESGIPASVSQTAGTFVCNHLFYGLMHYLAQSEKAIRGGFIHIPFLPGQAVHHPGRPHMSLETIVQGLKVAIASAVKHEKDLSVPGGQVS